MNWIVASIALSVLGYCLSRYFGNPFRRAASTELVLACVGIVRVVGYWLVTTPDPGRRENDPAENVRRILRFMVVFNYLAAWAALSVFALPRSVWEGITLVKGLTG